MEVDPVENEEDDALLEDSGSETDDVGDFNLSNEPSEDEDEKSPPIEPKFIFAFNPLMKVDEGEPTPINMPELVNAIFEFLPVSDLENVRSVNKCWREEGAKLLRKKGVVRLVTAEKMIKYVETFGKLAVRSLIPQPEQRNFPHISFIVHQLDLTDDGGFWQKIGPHLKEITFKQLNFTDGPIRSILERKLPNLEKLTFRTLPRQFLPLPKETDLNSDEESSDEDFSTFDSGIDDAMTSCLRSERHGFHPRRAISFDWRREMRRRIFQTNEKRGKPIKKNVKKVKNEPKIPFLTNGEIVRGVQLYDQIRNFALNRDAELGDFEDEDFDPFEFIPLEPFSIYTVKDPDGEKNEETCGSSIEPQPGPSRFCNSSQIPESSKENPFGIHNIPDNDLERILFPSSQDKSGLIKLRILTIGCLDRIRPMDLNSFLSFFFNLARNLESLIVLKDAETPSAQGQMAHETLLTRCLFKLLVSPQTNLPRLEEMKLPLLCYTNEDLLNLQEKNFPLRKINFTFGSETNGQNVYSFLKHFSAQLESISFFFPPNFPNPSKVFGRTAREFKNLAKLELTNYRGTFNFLHNLTSLVSFQVDGIDNGLLETFPFNYSTQSGLKLKEFLGVNCKMTERALTSITIGFPHLTSLWAEGVKDEGLGIIYREMPYLKVLKLKKGEFSDSGITGVSAEVCTDVMETMTYNITDPDKFRTNLFIGSLSNLKVLELDCGGMKDLSIIFGLTSCLTLYDITLSSPEITDAGMRFLAIKLGGNRSSLRKLDVSGCVSVSAEGHFFLKDRLVGRSILFSTPTPIPPRVFTPDIVRASDNSLRTKFRGYMENLRITMTVSSKYLRNYPFLAFLAENKIGYALNPEGSQSLQDGGGDEGNNDLMRYYHRFVEFREAQERLRMIDLMAQDQPILPNIRRQMTLREMIRGGGELQPNEPEVNYENSEVYFAGPGNPIVSPTFRRSGPGNRNIFPSRASIVTSLPRRFLPPGSNFPPILSNLQSNLTSNLPSNLPSNSQSNSSVNIELNFVPPPPPIFQNLFQNQIQIQEDAEAFFEMIHNEEVEESESENENVNESEDENEMDEEGNGIIPKSLRFNLDVHMGGDDSSENEKKLDEVDEETEERNEEGTEEVFDLGRRNSM